MPRTAIRLSITGHVQGVGYRWWAMGEALRLGLAGWVRNRRDGSVELLVIGDDAAIDRLAQACAHGPAGAGPDRVTREPATDDGSQGFEQRPTA
jgi:acylphosphatase